MAERGLLEIVNRRTIVLGTAGAAVALALSRRSALSEPTSPTTPAATAPATPAAPAPSTAPAAAAPRRTFDEVYAQLTKGAKPTEGKITVEVPEIAENGNVVPFTITVDSPMTDASHVRAVHLLSTENPQPLIATFRFTPLSGKAIVASRMRLAKTQDVVVLAELGEGKFWLSRSTVKVTIGGCGA